MVSIHPSPVSSIFGEFHQPLFYFQLSIVNDIKLWYPRSLEGHIKADMALFMVAGTDTSSVTLTFCLLLLLNNPDKLKKLAAELDEAFPSRDDPITFEKTNNLPYLNAALNESMRVMPVAVGMLNSNPLS